MTIALGLLAAAVVMGVAAPSYLRTAATPSLRPGLALAGWVSSTAMMLVAALGAAVLLVLPRSVGVDGLIGMANSCVNIIRGGEIVAEHIVRLGLAGVIIGLAARSAVIAVRRVRQHRCWRRAHLTLLRSVCQGERSVLWIEEAKPVAYSVAGRRHGTIVATTGVRRLGALRCEAVLAHERAHLRGRHHLLILAADILSAALPFVPLARRAPGAIRILAELAADASAARSHGPGPLRSALLAMSQGGTPAPTPLGPHSGALEMSRESVEARLLWLSTERAGLRRLPVQLDYVAGAALTAIPTVASLAVVATLVALYCLGVTG
ncbi:M56 family metallopeptidase [Prauserella oleivorans]|uniref:Antirepressor n=2 Tax=Prauserella TaxID=142577 RepID=A0A318LEZ5_9PSEU|nr:M56 family metallopeptidase [Prauserella flavalba]PXY25526.1 antirepressor [Prauserella flavalba]